MSNKISTVLLFFVIFNFGYIFSFENKDEGDVYNLSCDFFEMKNEYYLELTDEEIIYLVVEGVDIVYQMNYIEYKNTVKYNINSKKGNPDDTVKKFIMHIIIKFEKLGKDIPFKNRQFYWDYIGLEINEKMNKFMSIFDDSRLQYDSQKKYIEQECKLRSIFG